MTNLNDADFLKVFGEVAKENGFNDFNIFRKVSSILEQWLILPDSELFRSELNSLKYGDMFDSLFTIMSFCPISLISLSIITKEYKLA